LRAVLINDDAVFRLKYTWRSILSSVMLMAKWPSSTADLHGKF